MSKHHRQIECIIHCITWKQSTYKIVIHTKINRYERHKGIEEAQIDVHIEAYRRHRGIYRHTGGIYRHTGGIEAQIGRGKPTTLS